MFHLINRLIGRLSVSRKLILIYALDLSAVIFISTILINEKFIAIDFARREIIGNTYIAELTELFFQTTSPTGFETRADSAARIEQRHGAGMETRELSASLVEHLRTIEQTKDTDSYRQHAMTRSLQTLITRIGNQSNLILDPDLDSYYTMSLVVLRFPELFDLYARISDKALEARRAATSAERTRLQTEYLIIEGKIDAVTDGISSDYTEAFAANRATLAETLRPSRDHLLAAVNQFRSVTHYLALEHSHPISENTIRTANREVEASLAAAWREANTALMGLLTLRIDGLFYRMWWHLGTAVALLLLILTVVYLVARTIAVPIRRLSSVAETVSRSSNYALRAEWHADDELGGLIKTFNDMLEKLNQSRMVERELAASSRAAEAQRKLLEAIPIPLMVTAIPRHQVLHANQAARDWLTDQSSDPWMSGLERSHRFRFFQQLADLGSVNEFEALWESGSEKRWVLLSARRLMYQEQEAVLTAFSPIGRIKQMEERLEIWARVFESSSESIMVTNGHREIVTVNRAFSRASAYEQSEVIGHTPAFLRSDRHQSEFFEEIWNRANRRGSWQGELWIRRKNGEVFPIWSVINAIRDKNGALSNYVVAFLDISERKESEQRISHLAHHDALTDLPNRTLCLDRLSVAMQQADRANQLVGVLFLDLDHFKGINDSLGHHIGDGLLKSVAKRLRGAVRAGDTVSRFAGDEFVVVFSSVENLEEITQIVENRLIPSIREPHHIDGAELTVSCSAGISIYPDDGTTIEILLRNADIAMYQAKQMGRNNARFFTAEMDRSARERLEMEQDLRLAIDNDEFELFYQPRVDAESGRFIAAEALIRWHRPKHGLVPPSCFIPVAEECGLIADIGKWVFSEACRQHAEWRDSGTGRIPVSVNLSIAQFKDPQLLEALKASIERHRVEPEDFELELTESILLDDVNATVQLLHEMKQLGLRLSIDDFGTGYSSLSVLYRFPIDKLKIDRSFVADMLIDHKDLIVTQAIIGLGHTLGLTVVGEGVECVEQRIALSNAGCDELQGFYFSRPLPAKDLARWIAGLNPHQNAT